MKSRTLVLVAVALGLLANSPAQAERRTMFITVEELSEDCAGDHEICIGFITGVADALEATAWPAKRTCRGNEVQLQVILDLATDLLLEPPANKMDGPAFDYLANAIVEKWPC